MSGYAHLGRVALFGLGSSTRAVGEWLAGPASSAVESVTVFGGSGDISSSPHAGALRGLGIEVVEGTDVRGSFDLGVPSPGIPAVGDFFKAAGAACDELVSEPELAWRASPWGWAAVTGTNGKTTTTSLATELLRGAGIPAQSVGNIGLPPISLVEGRDRDSVFVAELSSFQLETTRLFHPRVAVLLNITPDHVEWHGSLEAYAAAKERAFQNMDPGDLAVVGPDPACRQVGGRCAARGVRTIVLGDEPGACALDGAWLDSDGRLTVRLHGADHVLCTFDGMSLKGPHNALNALAAAAAAIEMGAPDAAVAQGLLAFSPLAHRVEPCGEVGGVLFVDDSKATNTDAAVKALESFDAGSVVILLGGHDKGTDLAELAEKTLDTCRAAVTYGEAGGRIAEALAAHAGTRPSCACELLAADHMAGAFAAAVAAARPGDVVLLSPACSSFDEFGSYKERGDAFKELVRAHGASAGAGAGGAAR